MWTPLVACVLAAVSVAGQKHKLDLKQCSDHPDAKDIVVKSAEVTELVPGNDFQAKSVVLVKKELTSEARIKMTIKLSSGAVLPCFLGLGSCEYKMCGGDSKMEKFLGSSWGNTCPIRAKEYTKDSTFPLPGVVKYGVGDGNVHLRIEATDGGQTVGCVEFDVKIKV